MTTHKNHLIYGRKPIVEALQANQKFEKIFLQQGGRGEHIPEVFRLAKELGIVVQQVPIKRLNQLVRGNHQGIVGYLALIPYYELEDLLGKAYGDGEVPLFLLLDGLTDVRNVGGIARTAACAKIHGLILPKKKSAIINAEAVKASAGALLNDTLVCKVSSVIKCMEYLKANGLQIVATDAQKSSKRVDKIDLTIPSCIVVGAEDKGIPASHLELADELAYIPILSDFNSYNVSVATGIMLYEAMMQRFEKS